MNAVYLYEQKRFPDTMPLPSDTSHRYSYTVHDNGLRLMDLRTSENCPSFRTNSERKLENDSERVTLFRRCSREQNELFRPLFAVDIKNVISFRARYIRLLYFI